MDIRGGGVGMIVAVVVMRNDRSFCAILAVDTGALERKWQCNTEKHRGERCHLAGSL